jgi:hypothetical protein
MALKFALRESNLRAASLLEALNPEGSSELDGRLESAAALDSKPVEDTAESERLELLAGIAAEIRGLIAADHMERAGVYIGLLRGLAEPGPTSIGASTQQGTLSSDWN